MFTWKFKNLSIFTSKDSFWTFIFLLYKIWIQFEWKSIKNDSVWHFQKSNFHRFYPGHTSSISVNVAATFQLILVKLSPQGHDYEYFWGQTLSIMLLSLPKCSEPSLVTPAEDQLHQTVLSLGQILFAVMINDQNSYIR